MIEALKNLESEAAKELSESTDPKLLEALKIKYLGRKGLFASLSGRIGELTPEEKRLAGQEMNRVKQALESLFLSKQKEIIPNASGGTSGKISWMDLTMPGTFRLPGNLHPLTRVIAEVSDIFGKLGFSLVDGPEVETERYNFEALNIPLNHPARDSFDTFYLDDGKLLRSQTSTVQIHVMEKTKPPVKIIAPGKVFRPDATDATHSFMFHQIEGLLVDEQIRFSDLKGVLYAFARDFFGPKTKLRFRPHFFPFTEPSAEIDIYSETRGWLEILGAGMVHPHVLKSVKIDSEKYSGFAFGMGVERLAMLKYGVEDIRQFFESDVRFLRQF
jgi:phenylalanyl-tRNA synthetase alpha chain